MITGAGTRRVACGENGMGAVGTRTRNKIERVPHRRPRGEQRIERAAAHALPVDTIACALCGGARFPAGIRDLSGEEVVRRDHRCRQAIGQRGGHGRFADTATPVESDDDGWVAFSQHA
jgi:hypothetical protein